MKAKAISLHQPFASAIALGAKLIETRSWATAYRGELLIHAARTTTTGREVVLDRDDLWRRVLKVPPTMGVMTAFNSLPFGAIVARCTLVDCVATRDLESLRKQCRETGQKYSRLERELGDYRHGRYAWILKDVEALRRPIPCKGFQNVFDVELPDGQLGATA